MAKDQPGGTSPLKSNREILRDFNEKGIPHLHERGVNAKLLAALSQILKKSCIQLNVKGKHKDKLGAIYFAHRDEHQIVVWPLHPQEGGDGDDWADTHIQLPALAPCKWEDQLTKETVKTTGSLDVSDLFETVPLGFLKGLPFQPARRAGVLMHVSSLTGDYGVGDFGPGAKAFIDFLQATGQRYWQILPLSVTSGIVDYSPYSSFSAFAGNSLFVDPIGLYEMGLLDVEELSKFKVETGSMADFAHAEKAKSYFLKKAWERFKEGGDEELQKKFESFQEKEAYWLVDFARFVILNKQFNEPNWQRWPKAYRHREEDLLNKWTLHKRELIEEVVFQQFIFSEQWQQLKEYANHRGVDVFGDMPIYISYHSADVWAHPDLFRLKADKSMDAVAGVPPDYFNEKGQLWGMPLFDWKVMEENGYDWWLRRIQKNLEWFDLLRLDHFRGFAAFWEVPAQEKTAIHGKWTSGPGAGLFEAIQKMFPQMPFVAEDLGDIDQPVYDLRDRFGLPGMKVVQFGFDKYMPFTDHTPCNHTYNSIVYTGTHDNNTLKGWLRQEAGKDTLKRFKQFSGLKMTPKNCCREMIRVAYASTAKLAVIPMQDWLELDENSRMNFPATSQGNWRWRMIPGQMNHKLEKKILKRVKQFGRY